jgi:hypothetical protein
MAALRKLWCALLLTLALPITASGGAAAGLSSGGFDGLLLAVDADGRITGYYRNATGDGERFTCIFSISGHLGNGPSRVLTWYPLDTDDKDVIEGVLEQTRSGGVALKLREEHGGCGNVQPFADTPQSFERSRMEKWIAIRVVAAKKAHFHDQPSDGTRRKAYAVRGDGVGVLERRPGWSRAELGKTSGWIREQDLAPADPPAGR